MDERTKTSVMAVLSAAIHNAKMAQDQVESLVNPDDNSFQDYEVDTKELAEAVKSLEEHLERVSATKTTD